MFIIIGLIVGLLVLFAEQMLNGGPRIGDEEESWMTLSEVDVSGWVKAVSAAVICGATRYVIPVIDGKSPLIIVLYIALAVMLMILCREWHYNVETDISELIPFLILAAIFGGLMLRLSVDSLIGNAVVQAIMSWFAYALTCVTILYIIVRHLAVNHKLSWLMPVFAIVAFIVFVWSGVGVTRNAVAMMNDAANKTEKTTVEQSAKQEATNEPIEAEDSRFVQKWTSNENNRLDNDFSAKLAKKAADGEITAEMVEEAVLENCGHDARMLAIWANAFGLKDDPNEYANLLNEDETYLSKEGIELYHKLEGYLAATKIVREEAPSDGTNTGYDDGYVASETAGITGDRTGTKFTSPDENVEQFWLMDRCSNLVYKKTPNVPKGKTDEPKKPGKGDSPSNPTKPKYDKDPNKAPKKNTEPNDDKGPGPNTNNPSNPNRSTKDTNDSSSNSGKSYEDYKKDVKEKADTNKNQKTGNDSNTPSTPKPSPSTKVDNNADKGTGNGGINTPTPTKEKAKEADTGKTINDKAGEEWGGPSD